MVSDPPRIGWCVGRFRPQIAPLDPSWWVKQGLVLAGEYPGNRDQGLATEKVNLLIDHGIRTFVDLTTPDDRLKPYAAMVAAAGSARGLDLRHVSCPIRDLGVIDHDGYDQIIATIRQASTRGGVYVHCWGGVGRTATVAGCLLIADGLTADEAAMQINELRAGSRKARRPAPETPAQQNILRERTARQR